MRAAGDGEPDGAVAVGPVDVRDGRRRAATVDGRGMAVVVAAADLDRGDLGAQPPQHVGQPRVRAAVVRDLHRLDAAQREREDRLALGVGGQPDVERAGADDRRDTARVRLLGRRHARRPRLGRQHTNDQRADPQHLAGARRHAPDPARVGLGEQPEEVRIRRAVAVLEQQPCRDPLEHRVQPALVVARLVRRDHEVQALDPGGGQLPVQPRLGRPAVEQHAGAVPVLDQRRVALADVEERDHDLARPGAELRRRRGGHLEPGDHRQRPRRPARAPPCGGAAARLDRAAATRRARPPRRRR